MSLEISDEGQVVLIAEQHERARTGQGVGVDVVEAGAGDRLQIAARRIPGIGGVDWGLRRRHGTYVTPADRLHTPTSATAHEGSHYSLKPIGFASRVAA